MLKLNPLAANMTEIEVGAYSILFSYKTPVAGHSPVLGHFKTSTKYSSTTTRHINKYFANEWDIVGNTVREVDQSTIDGLVVGIGGM